MFGCQLLHVNECQPSERCKDEDITHDSDTLQWKVFVVDGEQFIHCQELADNLFLMKLDTDKRVFGYPFVCQGEIGYLLQAFHVADNGVLLAGLFRFEVKLKGTNQLPIDFRQRQILFPILLFDKLCEIAFAALITADGNQCIVFSHEGTALVVMFLYGADERADLFRLLVLSEEFFLQ